MDQSRPCSPTNVTDQLEFFFQPSMAGEQIQLPVDVDMDALLAPTNTAHMFFTGDLGNMHGFFVHEHNVDEHSGSTQDYSDIPDDLDVVPGILLPDYSDSLQDDDDDDEHRMLVEGVFETFNQEQDGSSVTDMDYF